MKRQSLNLTKCCVLIYLMLIVLLAFHIGLATDIGDFFGSASHLKDYDFSEGWTANGMPVNVNAYSAGYFGGRVVYEKTLPNVLERNDSLCISTSNLQMQVYFGQEMVYAYDTRENFSGYGDGIAYHVINLTPEYAGQNLRIEAQTAFRDGTGGRINEVACCTPEEYRYCLMDREFFPCLASLVMILLGILALAGYFGLHRKNKMMRRLWAMGLSAILFGLWNLMDTGVPQYLTGMVIAGRTQVYSLLHLAIFPLIYFVHSVTRVKRPVLLWLSFGTAWISILGLLFARFSLGIDMHQLVPLIYFSYGSGLLWMCVILADNEIWCRKKRISSNLRYFYIGALCFIFTALMDMSRYLLTKTGSYGTGSWFRLGLMLFFIFMVFQVFLWWSTEKNSLERDRFVNHLLQEVLVVGDAETKIGKLLESLCRELKADRAYIFEDRGDGTFDNTYEYCAEGVTPQIGNLQGIPYEGVVDSWYEEYRKGGHILIYDIEKYKSVSENMYNVLKPQDIHTLVTGPLMLDGEYIGFFGVDNPPAEMMREISEIIRLLMYFLSEMIFQRNNQKTLLQYSYHDVLTGAKNRRAIREFERQELDTGRSYGYLMCDINGLKVTNDTQGHDAGDEMIRDVAECLKEVFGAEHLYRMGGDEFAVYVYRDTPEELDRDVERVRALLESRNRHAAIGTSFARAGDADYHRHKTEADNRMYEDKRRFYSAGGHDRRKAR
ncbi:MAG: diguanylate cyclase [Lachnospiraceae bacterium]|nr:diguanylate cyclase [Lachnospiraceae bacterium]